MEKIILINVETENVETIDYDIKEIPYYGRSLATYLLNRYVGNGVDGDDKDNAIIIVPGLLAGTPSPSTGRMTIITKKKPDDVHISNLTGNMPQKLGSLNIAGVVIKGKSKKRNLVIHLSKESVSFTYHPELQGKYVSEIIEQLRLKEADDDAAIIGTGIGGDLELSLSTVFSTYRKGKPVFNCSRNGFGDIFGNKGLRAILVKGEHYFKREIHDEKSFKEASKSLSNIILSDEVCSKALPGYGSMTLVKMLKNEGKLPEERLPQHKLEESAEDINRSCAPLCVVGCLNRHSQNTGEVYESPDQSELETALLDCLGIKDHTFLMKLQSRIRDLCIVSPEFITAARSYFVAEELEPTKERLLSLLDEIEKGSELGKLIGSRALGIYKAYPHKKELQTLVDKGVLEDEAHYDISLDVIDPYFEGVPSLDLLYFQIFALENLGFCIFTSFGIVNNPLALEYMAKLYASKTGQSKNMKELLLDAKEGIAFEGAMDRANGKKDVTKNIPPFTKVLYRYFSN